MTNFKIGHIYKIKHCRKGIFSIQVKSQSEEWVTGVIIKGIADAVLDYNVKYEGEEITTRKSFITVLIGGI